MKKYFLSTTKNIKNGSRPAVISTPTKHHPRQPSAKFKKKQDFISNSLARKISSSLPAPMPARLKDPIFVCLKTFQHMDLSLNINISILFLLDVLWAEKNLPIQMKSKICAGLQRKKLLALSQELIFFPMYEKPFSIYLRNE